ncbi:MAG TPA: PEP-CTERM sorting domain-containing protein [Thermoanaerobaculia bacterium]|jgi:hypothetical protein
MRRRSRRFLRFILLSIFGAFATAAEARAVGFDCITNTNAGNCAIGEAQLSVVLSSPGATQVRFDLANAMGGAASVIAGVYWDDAGLLGSIASIVNGANTLFSANGSPPTLPGGNNAVPPFVEDFRVNADAPPPQNGVGPGETLGVIFNLASGVSVAQALAAFDSGALRVGIHVIAFGNNGSESFVNVPEPSAALLMALGVAALAIGRRFPK